MSIEHQFSLLPRFSRGDSSKEAAPTVKAPERARYERPVRNFYLPEDVLETLPEKDKKILELLTRASMRLTNLYALQESTSPKAKFYPSTVTKTEVTRQAQNKPEILDPYTVVEYDANGELTARPVVEVYREQIRESRISRLLREAANEAGSRRKNDQQLAAYLRAKATSLETGNFKSAERIWLEREGEEPTVDIVIGLYDNYTDKFLGAKYAWQAWVGVLDREGTNDSQWFSDSFLTLTEEQTGQKAPKVKMRIDHTRIMSGQAARYRWIGNSLPCQKEWRDEMGSKFTIFRPVFEDKFRQEKLPTFREVIDPEKMTGITDGFIRTATLRKHVAHELRHSSVPGEEIQRRFGKETAWIKELYCDLSALTTYRQLKGVSLKESEVAMAMALADGHLDYIDRHNRPEYHLASTTLANYCIEDGSIQVEDGRFTWADTQAVFISQNKLLDKVTLLLEEGRQSSVRDLKQTHFKPEIYRMSDYPPIILQDYPQS